MGSLQRLYLRDEPHLENFVDEHRGLARDTNGPWSFDGVAITIAPYAGDVHEDRLRGMPAIAWTLSLPGAARGDGAQERLLAAVGRACRGALYREIDDSLTWYVGDHDTPSAPLEELAPDMLSGARGESPPRAAPYQKTAMTREEIIREKPWMAAVIEGRERAREHERLAKIAAEGGVPLELLQEAATNLARAAAKLTRQRTISLADAKALLGRLLAS